MLSLSKFSTVFNESGIKTISANHSSPASSDTLFKGFQNYVCAPPWEDSSNAPWNITHHLSSYQELNYNAAHMWISDCDSLGFFRDDTLRQDQRDRVSRIINDASQKGLTSVFERVNISNLCFSQRIVYEAEGGNYGFSYQRRSANLEQDSGRTVVHACRNESECPQTDATPRMLCDSIYENLQHSDLYYWYPGTTDTSNFWHIKPVMRIDSNIFSPVDTTPVIAIVTKNFLGNKIDSIIIKVNNFAQTHYSGNYLENYFGVNPQVKGRLEDTLSLNFGRAGAELKNCKVDFKVYWFGLVDVWFDKMIVDDERANKLFDPNPLNNYDKKIKNEVDLLHDKMVFFVDELVSSQAYTTKYVIDKMKGYQQDCKIEFALSNNLNMHSHRNNQTRSRMLFDIIRPEIVCLDDHVFLMDEYNEPYRVYLPNNSSGHDPYVPASWMVSSQSYNDRLQNVAFGNKDELGPPYQGTFIYQITKIRNDLREFAPNAKFIVQPQLHSWLKTDTTNHTYEYGGFREIINEEIQAEAMIAISHGAQSFNWCNYHSQQSNNKNLLKRDAQNSVYTILGLRNDASSSFSKRTSNIIHQNKWEYVKAMNLKILHWKPTLDKIKWQEGYSIHSEGANHNFISQIKSIYRDPSSPYSFSPTNEDAIKFWEMGFFDPDFTNPDVSSDDKSKYFIMVNRRCVPDSPNVGTGDLRQLKIKLDFEDLTLFAFQQKY